MFISISRVYAVLVSVYRLLSMSFPTTQPFHIIKGNYSKTLIEILTVFTAIKIFHIYSAKTEVSSDSDNQSKRIGRAGMYKCGTSFVLEEKLQLYTAFNPN